MVLVVPLNISVNFTDQKSCRLKSRKSRKTPKIFDVLFRSAQRLSKTIKLEPWRDYSYIVGQYVHKGNGKFLKFFC